MQMLAVPFSCSLSVLVYATHVYTGFIHNSKIKWPTKIMPKIE
jgi:hypothetical protein